ncbi:carboxypeptidase-like regulatory domain-containing protein [Kaistella anthropi]|nr:carboxypeptidase-like regulatory domain-containing protein [Kaistella anthropi]
MYTVSDEYGNFVFLNVPAGKYTMKVDYIGYGSREYELVIDAEKTQNKTLFLIKGSFNKRSKIDWF